MTTPIHWTLAILLVTPAVRSQQEQEPARPDAIHWEPDLATAKARAAKDGKPVLAYFTFDT